MVINSIVLSAWLIKPIIGYVIDNSFSKKIWIFISLALDIITVLFIGLLNMPIFILIAVLLMNSTNGAFRDVSADGIMCVEGKIHKATGRIQSVQWIAISASGLITGLVGGIIAQKWDYRVAFLFLIPIYILVGLIASFYQETPALNGQNKNNSLFAHLKELLTDKNLIIVALFIFLYKYSPSFGTPLFFIQRDAFKWGKVWIGALATIGTIFEISGALLYYKFSQKIKMKQWLFFSVFLGAVTTLSYLYYTPVTAVIYNVFYSFIGMFIFLMVMDFMARNTTKGFEATSFALLCSVSNLALVTSNLSGAFLLPKVGLKWLIILSALTSFLCLPLINKMKEV